MWLGLTTGFQTRISPSATSAPKPSPQLCPSTTAGPVDRVFVAPAPHTSGLYPPEAGTTRSGCVTAATPAQIVCDLYKPRELLKVHLVFLRWSTKPLWVLVLLLQDNTEDWSYRTKWQNWNQSWFCVKRQDVLKLQMVPTLAWFFFLSVQTLDHLYILLPSMTNWFCSCNEVKVTTALLHQSNCSKNQLDKWKSGRVILTDLWNEDIRLNSHNSRARTLNCTQVWLSLFIHLCLHSPAARCLFLIWIIC